MWLQSSLGPEASCRIRTLLADCRGSQPRTAQVHVAGSDAVGRAGSGRVCTCGILRQRELRDPPCEAVRRRAYRCRCVTRSRGPRVCPGRPSSLEADVRLQIQKRGFGAGSGTRTRDILLGKIVPAPLNLFEPQNGHFGPSWPSASKGLSPLSPQQCTPPEVYQHLGLSIELRTIARSSTSTLPSPFTSATGSHRLSPG